MCVFEAREISYTKILQGKPVCHTSLLNLSSSNTIRLEVITERPKHLLMPHDQNAKQIQNIVTDSLKEFLGNASAKTAITQQYRTLRFSACPPQSYRATVRRDHVTSAFRSDVSNREGSCVFLRSPTRRVILK
jgi:hypothetical protein